jgi:glutathione S-transferase
VPVLEVAEGTFIGQSAAIMRYLGKRSGLYPSDPIAAAVVDSIIDEEIDLFMGLSVSAYKGEGGLYCASNILVLQ